jgi:Zn finger protein HypA/HybF involved in hydrogenase expression
MEVNVIELECKKCGHRWFPRGRDVRICPACKSAWWDLEKKNGTKEIVSLSLEDKESKNEPLVQ